MILGQERFQHFRTIKKQKITVGKNWSIIQQLIEEGTAQIQEAEDFLEKAGEKDYCFVENLEIENFRDKIEKIILCKWNRKYPGDFFFTIDVNDGSWKLKGVEEFSGSSHEKITLEVYEHE